MRTLLLSCIVVALVCVVYPIYVIRPFRAQGETELAVALVILQYRAAITVVAALVAIFAAVRSRRKLAIAGALLTCVLAVLARVNVYERMFHRIDRAAFASVSEVKLDQDEKVLAIKVDGEPRAYPVRSLAYHHLVNDEVGQRAIVATY